MISIDHQTIPKISFAPSPFSDETSLLHNLWIGGGPTWKKPTTNLIVFIGKGLLYIFYFKEERKEKRKMDEYDYFLSPACDGVTNLIHVSRVRRINEYTVCLFGSIVKCIISV
jgi:hypothetical protein